MGKGDIALPRGQSLFQVVGRFVPNAKYGESDPQCKVYRMKLFAKNRVVARSRFWYFMSRMCRVKKANGQIISVSQIFEKAPEQVKNIGIWFRYDSRTGTHNAYKEYREVSLTNAVNSLCAPRPRGPLPAARCRSSVGASRATVARDGAACRRASLGRTGGKGEGRAR